MKLNKKIFLIIPVVILYFIVNNIISADSDSENKLVIFLRNNIDPELRYKIKQNFSNSKIQISV